MFEEAQSLEGGKKKKKKQKSKEKAKKPQDYYISPCPTSKHAKVLEAYVVLAELVHICRVFIPAMSHC